MLDYDVVVIGSGIGGLAAAVALANAGRRVGMFEQHTLPGGWAHSFTLDGYSFCAGLHYVGELGEGGGLRRLLEGLGLGQDLTFFRQRPEAYEHAVIAGENFDVPAGRDHAVARLVERFPAERSGIGRYFDVIARMYRELGEVSARTDRSVAAAALASPTLLRYGWTRFDRFLDGFTSDPRLRAILSIQAGDHGVPPSRCSAAVHTAVTSHYLDGGYFPRGGGRGFVKAFVKALRRHGGELHVGTPVRSILVDGRGRSIGIALRDGTEVRAPLVISNADPGVTWGSLVPQHAPGRALRRRLTRERWSAGMVSLFFAVDADVRALGVDSGNYWYSRTTDVGATYEYARNGLVDPPPPLPGLYLGCSSLKDPKARRDGHHTFEAFSFVPTEPFQRWADSNPDHRPADYLAFKEAYADRMFDAIDALVPGLRASVVHHTVSTPVTNRFYVAATRGAAYGTERRLRNMGRLGFDVNTPIEGLLQCGASTVCHGVYGAALSGVVAAEIALGCSREQVLSSRGRPLTILSAEPEQVSAPQAAIA